MHYSPTQVKGQKIAVILVLGTFLALGIDYLFDTPFSKPDEIALAALAKLTGLGLQIGPASFIYPFRPLRRSKCASDW